MKFNGLDMGLHSIMKVSDAKTRSISAENFSGEKGKGGMAVTGTGEGPSRELGIGWKVSPSVAISAKSSFNIAQITGSGCIQHIWMTTSPDRWRSAILRMYWDKEETPSVEVPMGDFFCNGWCEPSLVNAVPITVNPRGGFNTFFPMPFRKEARIEIENLADSEMILYFQVDYCLTDVEEDVAYFHAQFRKSTPVQDSIHTVLDGVKGKGQYVGTYLAEQVNHNGWWGEGELKVYLDGDQEFPTICYTGTEDYFGGAWNFEQPKGSYCEFSTPYMGLSQVIRPDGLYVANTRFGMYRFHIQDPIRFEEDIKVTIQDLGWRSEGRYLKQKNDMASVAYWYQMEPHAPFAQLPDRDELEVI